MSKTCRPYSDGAAPSRSASPSLLAAAGMVLMVLMPLSMWLANRSAPLILGLVAAAFLMTEVACGQKQHFVDRVRRLISSSTGLAVSAFLVWAFISISWSHTLSISLSVWLELVLPISFALLIAASGPMRVGARWLRALALVIILACILSIIELASGLSQRSLLGFGKMMSFAFNRPAITTLILAIPTIHGLWTIKEHNRFDRALAVVMALTVVVFSIRSESASARLGVVVCGFCWLFALRWPRSTISAAGLAFILSMVIAPVLGLTMQNWLPHLIADRFPAMTGQARIDIWQSFGEVAQRQPITGAGFGTSANMHKHPVARTVSPEHRKLLAASHPHDMPLQAWAETGAIGAGILTLAGLLLLIGLSRLPVSEMAPRLALFTSGFAIAVVGHGAWQGWWIAVLGSAVLWFVWIVADQQEEDQC